MTNLRNNCWLGLMLLCGMAHATPDQIGVSDSYITVLVFDSAVCNVELASDMYAAKITDNYLMLISRKRDAPPTSLFVTYAAGKAFLHTIVCFAPTPPKTYDLRHKAPAAKGGNQTLLQGLQYIATLPQAYKDLGVRAERMKLILTNVVTDATHTYLQFFVENNTALNYEIEEMRFVLQQKGKKRQVLTPVLSTQKQWIDAYHNAYMTYVLPSYGVQAASKLLVELREEKGERILRFAIPGSILLKAPRMK